MSTVINANFPDVRKIINTLQQNSQFCKLELNTEESSYLDINEKIMSILTSNEIKDVKFTQIRQTIADAMIRDSNPIFRFLFDSAEKIIPSNPGSLILIVADAQYKDAFVIDHEINSMSMFVQIINEL